VRCRASGAFAAERDLDLLCVEAALPQGSQFSSDRLMTRVESAASSDDRLVASREDRRPACHPRVIGDKQSMGRSPRFFTGLKAGMDMVPKITETFENWAGRRRKNRSLCAEASRPCLVANCPGRIRSSIGSKSGGKLWENRHR